MLRFVIRCFTRRPWSSATVIVMLALAIGANTAIFSVAKAVIFAPLPFPRPDRVVQVYEGDVGERYQPGGDNYLSSVRNGTFQDWREQARSFTSMAPVQMTQAILMAGGRGWAVDGFRVGDGFFETLGVPARLGRYLTADDYAGDSRVVVLGDRLWREQYNADPAIVGREIELDGAAYRVAGIMPPRFLPTRNERDPQMWIPMRWTPATKYSRDLWGNTVYARLKDGVTLQQAQAEIDGISARIRAADASELGGGVVVPLDGFLFGHHERLFFLLLVAVGLVLLIACANVANLLLARALERQREFAVRAALGASRPVILRQVLAESLILAGAGGLAGVALSPLLIRPALALLPAASRVPRLDQVHLDLSVLVFTLLISIVAGLLFGVAPALRAASGNLAEAIKARGRGNSLGRREGWLSDALVVAEVAFSLVLLVGGGLLTRTFMKLMQGDPGFRPERSVALALSIPANRYGVFEIGGKNIPRQQLYDRLEKTVQSLSNVEAAGVVGKLPLRQRWSPWGFSIAGRPPLPTAPQGLERISKRWGFPIHGEVSVQTVTPGYFAALGIPAIRGRLFDDRDRPEAPMTTVINQAMVRKFFAGEDPLGRQIEVDMTSFAVRMTVVGVVGDVRIDGMNRQVLPELYLPMAHQPSANAWVVAHARSNASSALESLRRAVQQVDPEIGIVEGTTMTGEVGDSLWRERFSALLVGLFAALAVLIASGGLYAVISHAVERRTQELGVRVALGATAVHIARTVLGHGLRVWAIGMAAGAALTMAVSRLLPQQGYDVSDLPWMFMSVASLLLVLTLLACWVPLRRALAVDPMLTLRSE